MRASALLLQARFSLVRLGTGAGLLLAARLLSGCTLITDVDREKIPEPVTPPFTEVDAGPIPLPSTPDASPISPLPDAGASDAGDAGAGDASADASVGDAGDAG